MLADIRFHTMDSLENGEKGLMVIFLHIYGETILDKMRTILLFEADFYFKNYILESH